MKIHLKSFLPVSALALLLLAAPPAFAKPGWSEDQKQSLATAKSEKKLVLMDFTGSDWCGWCMKMDKEVFGTPEFKAYAAQHLVLVELDFPRQKAVSPETKAQNDELKARFGVQGFPTLVVLDGDGKTLKKFEGYQEGGAKAFIEQLKQLGS